MNCSSRLTGFLTLAAVGLVGVIAGTAMVRSWQRVSIAATADSEAESPSSGNTESGHWWPGGLGSLPLLSEAQTRSVSAENPTGQKGKGAMAIPKPGDPDQPH